MKTSIPVLLATALTATFVPFVLHADSLTVEGDLNVEPGGTANGDLTVNNELTVNQNDSVTAPAVEAAFKVEDNGVIWAGHGDSYNATEMIPEGDGTRMLWIPQKGAFRAGSVVYDGIDVAGNEWDYDYVGSNSVAFGSGTSAYGNNAIAWGYASNASGANATAWGEWTGASAYATAWGSWVYANGDYSTAWGYYSWTYAVGATAWGNDSGAMGEYSTAWGNSVVAGDYATAWGNSSATGDYATAWGAADGGGDYATAWGDNNAALGDYSTAWGRNSFAYSYASTVFGRYNVGNYHYTPGDGDDTNNGETRWYELDPLLEVGNGSPGAPSNALTIIKNGQTTLENKYWVDQDPTAIPTDPDAEIEGDQSSAGEALVVKGHARFEGRVDITYIEPKGDILMGAFK